MLKIANMTLHKDSVHVRYITLGTKSRSQRSRIESLTCTGHAKRQNKPYFYRLTIEMHMY